MVRKDLKGGVPNAKGFRMKFERLAVPANAGVPPVCWKYAVQGF
jgi:hypothetical protein